MAQCLLDPTSVDAVGDVNADGALDLVFIGDRPASAITAGDFIGNGRADIAIAAGAQVTLFVVP